MYNSILREQEHQLCLCQNQPTSHYHFIPFASSHTFAFIRWGQNISPSFDKFTRNAIDQWPVSIAVSNQCVFEFYSLILCKKRLSVITLWNSFGPPNSIYSLSASQHQNESPTTEVSSSENIKDDESHPPPPLPKLMPIVTRLHKWLAANTNNNTCTSNFSFVIPEK